MGNDGSNHSLPLTIGAIIVFRTVEHRATLWEAMLPAEALVMPAELVGVDRLLDDVRFFEPLRRWFDPVQGRPSIPMETYLRLMFLKYRYRLGYETLCAEVSDSLSWLRFCRIPLGERAPHPTTLMKLTTRIGADTIAEWPHVARRVRHWTHRCGDTHRGDRGPAPLRTRVQVRSLVRNRRSRAVFG